MSYLLIESRDPFVVADVRRTLELATGLAATEQKVTILFVENGVFAARESGFTPELAALATAGVTVLADAFSLKERGIDHARLSGGVTAASIDVVVDHLADGHKVLWH